MRIKNIETNDEGVQFQFDKEKRICIILDKSGEMLTCIDTIVEVIDDYSPLDYDVILLNNDRADCTENSIYQVMVNQKRIGWIFPIQAIRSEEHNYSANIHFLKYAYIAWVYLLEKCEVEVDSFDEFDLFSAYSDCCNILVLDKGNCRSENFLYENYMVSLFDYGYSEAGKGNLFTPDKSKNKSINLKKISPEFESNQYINVLFKGPISLEKNPISRFYVYYQLIEIMIEKVFEHLFQKFIKELNQSADNLFDKKEDLSAYTNEKYRLTRLCNDFSCVETALKNELHEKCCELLSYTGSAKQGNEASESLYYVRCLLVHRMYVLDPRAELMLETIDNLFLELCINLLMTYKNTV